jgi:DNA-binding NtrC family response regulator
MILYLKGGSSVVVEKRSQDVKDGVLEMITPNGLDEIVPLKIAAKEATVKAERDMILKALRGTNWNKKKAANLLQVSYKALLYKIKECGIEK